MNLPAIDIPFTLPFEVPVLLHPPLVHFAIVLPVVLLLLEIVNSVMKKRAISVVSLFLLLVLSVVLFGAFFTGKVDGSEAFSSMSGDAKAILKEHKLLGTYLAYGSLALLLLKFLNLTKKASLRIVYLLALVGFVAATLHQGKEGGELVFVHGTNIEAVADLKDELADATEGDEDDEDSAKATESSEDEAPAKVEEEKTEATPVKAEEKKVEEKATETKSEDSEQSATSSEEEKSDSNETNETK